MKRQYIAPSLLVVKVEMRFTLMQMSVNDKEIKLDEGNMGNFGLTREDNTDGNNNYSVWDNVW